MSTSMKNKWNVLTKISPLVYLLSVLFLISLERVIAWENQTDLGFLFSWYGLLGSCFIGLCYLYKKIPVNFLLTLAVLGQLVCFTHLPHLSTDYFRFIWDGELLSQGINPFDFTPNQYLKTHPDGSSYLNSLHEGMGSLSAANYSCYPTVNQFYFYLSTVCSNSISESVFSMRILLVFSHILGGWACLQILKILNKDIRRSMWLFLNPLVIIECTGNLHFEGVMLSFILFAIYFVMISKRMASGLFLTAAIHIKLIPLLIAGNIAKTLSMRKAVAYLSLVLFGVLFLFMVFINIENGSHFFASLRLYFSTFEFNSALVLPISEILHSIAKGLPGDFTLSILGEKAVYWNPVPLVSPILGICVVAVYAKLYIFQKTGSWRSFFEVSVTVLLTYYLLNSTIHPWYIIIPLGLSLFCENKISLLWSVTVFASYALYAGPSTGVRILVWSVQYIPILLMLFAHKKGLGWFRVKMQANEVIR